MAAHVKRTSLNQQQIDTLRARGLPFFYQVYLVAVLHAYPSLLLTPQYSPTGNTLIGVSTAIERKRIVIVPLTFSQDACLGISDTLAAAYAIFYRDYAPALQARYAYMGESNHPPTCAIENWSFSLRGAKQCARSVEAYYRDCYHATSVIEEFSAAEWLDLLRAPRPRD